jgi:hypothetical protein
MVLRMSALKDYYLGRPAAVLGGGPSLPGDLARLGILREDGTTKDTKEDFYHEIHERHEKKIKNGRGQVTDLPLQDGGKGHGWILVAVNYHAWQFCTPDFMVYNDPPAHDAEMAAEVARHRTVLVSSEKSSDVEFDVPVWEGFFSSNTAAWFALWLGCAPVVLCGMDCYQGEVKYCHSWVDQPSHHRSLDEIMRPWIEDGKNLLPNVRNLKAASGPLVGVFGSY